MICVDDFQQDFPHTLPSDFAKFTSNANPVQHQAIERSLVNPVSFIHGPPATGKTKVLTDIVRAIKTSTSGEKILVTSFNHVAVDEIEHELLKAINDRSQSKVTRFYSNSRAMQDWKHERIPAGNFGNTHIQMRRNNLARSIEGVDEGFYLKGLDAVSGKQRKGLPRDFAWIKWHNMHKNLTRKVIVQTAVIFCTSSSIRSDGMIWRDVSGKELCYPASTCIFDEAGSAKHVDIMQPVVTLRQSLKRLIFCGDDKQLGPAIYSTKAQRIWQTTWLTEMLGQRRFPVTMLNVQYRSHDQLYAPTDSYFYNENMQSVHRTVNPRPLLRSLLQNMPFPFSHLGQTWTIYTWRGFIDVSASSECAIKGRRGDRSSWNELEAEVISKLFVALVKRLSLPPHKIGVITAYAKQAIKLRNKARLDNWSGLNNAGPKRDQANNALVHTINACQGAEWDIVLISLVRNEGMGGAGFAGESRRANVATSRARECVYFVGDYDYWESMDEDTKNRVAMSDIIARHKAAHEENNKTMPFVAKPNAPRVSQASASTATAMAMMTTTTTTTTTSTTTTTVTAASTSTPGNNVRNVAQNLGQMSISSAAKSSKKDDPLPHPATLETKLVVDDASNTTATQIVKKEEQPKDEPISKVNPTPCNFLPLL